MMMLLIGLIRKKIAMSNEYVATNLIKTPLAIGLTTSVLAGCSMLPTLPTNNVFGKTTVTNTNKSAVKVRHAVPSIGNDNSNVSNSLPPVVQDKPLVSPQPQPTNNVVFQGKLWDAVLIEEASNELTNKQANPNDALARIEKAKQHWLTAQRNSLNTSLKNAPTYLHYLISQAEIRNLPPKLALLPLIESGYNPRAGKNAGANAPAGLWQITTQVANQLKVEKNPSYDARYDIKASTNTAYNFLGGLHRKYKGDWALALAAYNAGVPAVERAIAENKAQGKPTDFWSLNLPQETKQYVPRFLALVDIVKGASRYGVQLPFADTTRQLQFVRVHNGAKLDMVAPISSVPLDTLKALNAGLLRDRVDTFTPRDIILPALVPETVIKQVEQLPINYTYNKPYIPPLDNPDEPSTSNNYPVDNPNQPPRGYENNQPPLNRPPRYDARQDNRFQPQGNSYVVRSGDTLSGLAHKLSVPRIVLARLNGVDMEYRLKEGEVLQLPPNAGRNRGNVSANRVRNKARNNKNRFSQNRLNKDGRYKVKAGDTLSGIANKLHTTAKAIASLNRFDSEYLVKTGEVLIVPVSNAPKARAKKARRPILVNTNSHSGKYQVVSGDSLSSVAREFGLTTNQLARANNLDPESYLFIGQEITLPTKKSKASNKRKKVRVASSRSANKQFKRVNNVKSYRVQAGDSLSKLAKRYHVTVQTLAKMNKLSPLADLYTDTIIKVPRTKTTSPSRRNMGEEYAVRPGDGLIKLARKFNISVDELARMNNMSVDSSLFLGQTLRIPNY